MRGVGGRWQQGWEAGIILPTVTFQVAFTSALLTTILLLYCCNANILKGSEMENLEFLPVSDETRITLVEVNRVSGINVKTNKKST